MRIPQDPEAATWEPSLNPPRLYRPELVQLAATGSAAGQTYQTESNVRSLINSFS